VPLVAIFTRKGCAFKSVWYRRHKNIIAYERDGDFVKTKTRSRLRTAR